MNKTIIILLLFAYSFPIFATEILVNIKEDTYIIENFNIKNEADSILKFVKEFQSCSDPIKLQNFLFFPYVEIRHPKQPLLSTIWGIQSFISQDTYILQPRRAALSLKKSEFCKFIIDDYNFPIKFSDTGNITKVMETFGPKHKNNMIEVPKVFITGYGFKMLMLVKIDNKYKVTYLGFIYN